MSFIDVYVFVNVKNICQIVYCPRKNVILLLIQKIGNFPIHDPDLLSEIFSKFYVMELRLTEIGYGL